MYAFGEGLPESPKSLAYGEAAVNWEGQRVRATRSDGHNECWLTSKSKLAAARKAVIETAQKKAEAAARAAELCVGNAPTGR